MFDLAIQLIEKENKTGKFDLGYCNIMSIPKELSELPWLKELSLSSNQISDICLLEKFTANLSDNQISIRIIDFFKEILI